MLLNIDKQTLEKKLKKNWSEDDFIQNYGFKSRKDFYETFNSLLENDKEEYDKLLKQLLINNKKAYNENRKNKNQFDLGEEIFIPVIHDDLCVFPELNINISESLNIVDMNIKNKMQYDDLEDNNDI